MAIRFRPLSRLTALSSQFNPTHTQKIRIYRPLSTMSIPKTMKAVQIQKTGGIDVLDYHTDLLVPTPKEDEVLIKNSIIGVNYIDT